MKILYFDCPMGAAGDMLMGALFELCPDQAAFLQTFARLKLPGVALRAEPASSYGQNGTHMRLTVHDHEEAEHHHAHHHHHSPLDVAGIITQLPVSDWVKTNAHAVYHRIARAESKAHGVPVTEVHFHEVGALDAIGDVVGCCMLLEMIAPEAIFASPIALGAGTVRCAHGVLPVPAPATENLLAGIPTCPGPVTGELCTPTGAALLAHFAAAFGPRPALSPASVGCGIGTKDFGRPNCVYAVLGAGDCAGLLK